MDDARALELLHRTGAISGFRLVMKRWLGLQPPEEDDVWMIRGADSRYVRYVLSDGRPAETAASRLPLGSCTSRRARPAATRKPTTARAAAAPIAAGRICRRS